MSNVFETLFWYLNATLAAVAGVRALASKLAPVYPALLVFLLFLPARSALLMFHRSSESTYAWVYVLTTPAVCLLQVWTGLEVYRHVFEAYSGLAVLGRRSLLLTAAVGGMLAFGYAYAGSRVAGEPFPTLRFVLLFDSVVAFIVLFFLITLIGFMLWFPVPLKRNVVGYAFGLSAILATICTAVAVRVFAGAGATEIAGTVIMAVSALTFGWWAATLSKAGETVMPQGTLPRSPGDQERLLEQLKSLNAMARSVKNS